MEKFRAHECEADDVDDYVEIWHSSPKSETRSLHEFLGMTWSEYKKFVFNHDALLYMRDKLTPEQCATVLSGYRAYPDTKFLAPQELVSFLYSLPHENTVRMDVANADGSITQYEFKNLRPKFVGETCPSLSLSFECHLESPEKTNEAP